MNAPPPPLTKWFIILFLPPGCVRLAVVFQQVHVAGHHDLDCMLAEEFVDGVKQATSPRLERIPIKR